MSGVGTAGLGIDHHLGVAVIGGDDETRPGALCRFDDPRQALIDSLDCPDRRWNRTAVPHHGEKAREFTQDTFIRAFSRLSQFRRDAAFSTWLHRIVVTVVSNARRSEIRFAREVALDEAHSIEVSAPEADPDLKECIARAVENLSEAYRTTLIMHDIEGYTHAEIAAILGVPEGTSKSRLSAARAQLRQQLAAFKE